MLKSGAAIFLFLAIAVDASHRDVDIVVTVYDIHARHIGGEHLLQVLAPAVANHVFCNQGGGHGHLIERLCLAGGGGDLRCESQFDALHHIDEPLGVLRRGGVVGVLREQVPSPFLGLLVIVESEPAEGHQPVGTLLYVAGKLPDVILKDGQGLFDTADVVFALGLVVNLTSGAFLSLDGQG